MAIAFLDDINLNNNEIQNVVIQRLATDPTGVEGKIIYNNGSNTIKYYNGTSWIELDGLGGITGSGTVNSMVSFQGSSTNVSSTQLQTLGSGSLQSFTFNTTGAVTFGGDINAQGAVFVQTGLKDKDGDLGSNGQLLSSTGTQVNWIDAPISYTGWDIEDNGGNSFTIGDGNSVKINGSGAVTAVASSVAGGANVTLGLKTDVTIVGDLTVGGGDITLSGTGRIQGVDTVTTGTDAASKQYVDNAISGSGSLIFQGGYNAATNTPNLDINPLSLDILKGWTYVVTVGGSFFTETVEVGDLLIAEINDPTTLANWTTVQNNVDIATLTNVGIGNVIPSALNDQLGIGVVYNGSGTASLGLDIDGLTESGTSGNLAQPSDMMIYQDVSTTPSRNFKISILNLGTAIGASGSAVAVGSGGATYFIGHNFGTRNVIVEIFETNSPYQTVYGTVTRPNVNQVKVTFGATTGSLTFLVKKV